MHAGPTIAPDKRYIVDTNDLLRYGWSKWKWTMNSNKAKLLFVVLFGTIASIIAVIALTLNQGECQIKKNTISILIVVDLLLIGVSYKLIWPHTKWTSSTSPSEFTGYNQIAIQQAAMR